MKKLSVLVLFLLTPLLFAACISSEAKSVEGLVINGFSSALGGVDDNMDRQRLAYTLTLQNNESRNIYIQSVSPVINPSLSKKILSEQLNVAVERMLASKGMLNISGEFVFDSQGLSKEDIVNMGPIITGYRIYSTRVLKLPGYNAQ